MQYRESHMRFGLVGYGRWGKVIADALDRAPEHSLSAIFTRSGLPNNRSVGSLSDLINTNDIDALVVACPTSARPAIVEAALRRKKHVLTEKPLSFSYADSARLVRLAAEQGTALFVNYVHSFCEPFRLLQGKVNKSDIKFVDIFFGQPGPTYEEEGVETLLLSHALFMYTLLTGEKQHWDTSYRCTAANGRNLSRTITTSDGRVSVDLRFPVKTRQVCVYLDDITFVADLTAGTLYSCASTAPLEVSPERYAVKKIEPLQSVFSNFTLAVGLGDYVSNAIVAADVDRILESL